MLMSPEIREYESRISGRKNTGSINLRMDHMEVADLKNKNRSKFMYI